MNMWKKGLISILAVSLIGCTSIDRRITSHVNKASKIEYKCELPEDNWQTPEKTKKLRTGDCDDIILYLYDLLKKEVIESKVVFGYQKINKKYFLKGVALSHVWLEYKDKKNNEIYVLDPVREDKKILLRRWLSKTKYQELKPEEEAYLYLRKKFKKYMEKLKTTREMKDKRM